MSRWMRNPVMIVITYKLSVLIRSIPAVETTSTIKPNTPKGAKRMMTCVIFIIASKNASKNPRRVVRLFSWTRVMAKPRKMAKKMIPSMCPDDIASIGLSGIMSIRISLPPAWT